MAPGSDKPITALLDLAVDGFDEFGVGRQAADQIGEHAGNRDRRDRQNVGARGRVLLDRPRQGSAGDLNDDISLSRKQVFRHVKSLAYCVHDTIIFAFFPRNRANAMHLGRESGASAN